VTVIEFPAGGDSSARLSDRLGFYRFDPLGFVQHALPWAAPAARWRARAAPSRGSGGTGVAWTGRPDRCGHRSHLALLRQSHAHHRECFAGGRFAHRWQPQQIDSRSVFTFAYPAYRRNWEEERPIDGMLKRHKKQFL